MQIISLTKLRSFDQSYNKATVIPLIDKSSQSLDEKYNYARSLFGRPEIKENNFSMNFKL